MKLVVLGGGESGVGAAILGKEKGWEVFLSDRGKIEERYRNKLNGHGIRYEDGVHSEDEILGADCVVKSPGIPDSVEIVRKIRERGIKVISEIEFGYEYTKGKVIAISGSNGKTTTTSLIFHILKNTGFDAELVGNIGYSFAEQVAIKDREYYVAEISSFQLDGTEKFRPYVSILLNITPDHLDRYDHKFENYAASKMRICMNQLAGDFFIYNEDDQTIGKALRDNMFVKRVPFSGKKEIGYGAYDVNKEVIVKMGGEDFVVKEEDISIKGKHNMQNAMASVLCAKILGVDEKVIAESLKSFKGVEHRLEHIRVLEGVTFINDSKATNVDSVFYALDAVPNNIVWIVGGTDKGNDYSVLMDLVKEKVRSIICLGVDNSKIIKAFGGIGIPMMETRDVVEAVRKGYENAKKGYTVLLSPACASFDLFKNYEDRGEKFSKSVKEL